METAPKKKLRNDSVAIIRLFAKMEQRFTGFEKRIEALERYAWPGRAGRMAP